MNSDKELAIYCMIEKDLQKIEESNYHRAYLLWSG